MGPEGGEKQVGHWLDKESFPKRGRSRKIDFPFGGAFRE